MKLYIRITCLLLFLFSFSLSFAWLLLDWGETSFGDVVEQDDGSLLLCGGIRSTDAPSCWDFLMLKTDREGGELARTTFPYGGFNHMGVLFDGSIAACGNALFDTLSPDNASVTLFNSDLDTVWSRTFLVFDDDSEVSYAANIHIRDDTIYMASFNGFMHDSFAVLKIDRHGNLIHRFFIQTDFWVGVAPFIVREDGGFSMIFPEMTPYDRSRFLNLDASGEIICSTTYGIPTDTTIEFTRIYQCRSGGYYLIGYQHPGPDSPDQPLLAKVDDCGEIIWKKAIPDTAVHAIKFLSELSSGELDLIVMHSWTEYSGIGLMHCDSLGDSIWLKAFEGDSLRTYVWSAYKCINSDYVICGKYWSDPIYQGYIMRIDKLGNSVPITSVKEATLIPDAIVISHYPNPFNSSTRISVVLPESESISLTIYDIAGREIRNLHDGMLTAGEHSFEWNGKDNTGNEMPSGVYLYKIKTNEQTHSAKMMLLR